MKEGESLSFRQVDAGKLLLPWWMATWAWACTNGQHSLDSGVLITKKKRGNDAGKEMIEDTGGNWKKVHEYDKYILYMYIEL